MKLCHVVNGVLEGPTSYKKEQAIKLEEHI